MPGRFRPEGARGSPADRRRSTPPQPASSHSRAGGSRPSRVQAASHRSSRTCRDESRGSQSNGSRSASAPATTDLAGLESCPDSIVESVSWLNGSRSGRPFLRRGAACHPPVQLEPSHAVFKLVRFDLASGRSGGLPTPPAASRGTVSRLGHQRSHELGDRVGPVLQRPADAERLAVRQEAGDRQQPDPGRPVARGGTSRRRRGPDVVPGDRRELGAGRRRERLPSTLPASRRQGRA